MRKIIILLVIMAGFTQVKAQFVVTDPESYIQMAAQLNEAVSQTEELRKTWKIMSEANKALQVVSQVVKQVNDIDEVLDNTVVLTKGCESLVSRLKDMQHIDKKYGEKRVKEVLKLQKKTTKIIEQMTTLLTDNKLKLNDYERVSLFKSQKEELDVLSAQMALENQQIERTQTCLDLFRMF